MALQTLRPNAELDLLTKEELQQVVSELLSGYLRPPERLRAPSGVQLSAGGATVAAPGAVVYTVEPGMRLILTRVEFFLDGYTALAPYTSAGGIDLYVDGQWRDGFPFGGTSGFILPATYTESKDRAIVLQDGSQLSVHVGGGPANGGLTVNVCGILLPLQPVV